MLYYIENVGCDDTTSALIEMTENEAEIFIRICNELNAKSTCGCQPVIAMYKKGDYEIDKYVDGDVSIYPNYNKDLLNGREGD